MTGPLQGKIRVLIVDDQQVVRSALNMFLLAYDFERVGEASSGTEAVRLCRDNRPDVVLMDLLMPKVNGVTATKIIRKRWPRTQVIAMTGLGQDELRKCAMEAGAAITLLKDLASEEFASVIRAVYAARDISPHA